MVDIGDMRPTIDLVWTRDPEGYVLTNAELKWNPEAGENLKEHTPLADAGGYFLPEYKPLVDEDVRRQRKTRAREGRAYFPEEDSEDDLWLEIGGKSGKLVRFRPFEGAPNLFRDFAEIQTPEE